MPRINRKVSDGELIKEIEKMESGQTLIFKTVDELQRCSVGVKFGNENYEITAYRKLFNSLMSFESINYNYRLEVTKKFQEIC